MIEADALIPWGLVTNVQRAITGVTDEKGLKEAVWASRKGESGRSFMRAGHFLTAVMLNAMNSGDE